MLFNFLVDNRLLRVYSAPVVMEQLWNNIDQDMHERIHKATLSQSQGREGWSVIFRHPVLPDPTTGKPGRRVRRGLGTKEKKAAERVVKQLNEMLADRVYWEPGSRPRALARFDSEGLGHTPDAQASLPTAMTRRLEHIDAVLLVDNATQPMQAATVAAMRNLASSGQTGKLMICFTHFDNVNGDNIPTFKMKEQHVRASAENALTSIGEQLGSLAERGLRQRLQS